MENYNKNSHDEIFLGFPESPAKGDFNYENFPSKIGGKPIWLFPPTDLDTKFFKCDECGRSLFFLLQCYCPLEEFSQSFHRVIYLFFCHMCWKSSNTLKSLRLQLKEKNEFYINDELVQKFDEDLIEEKINKNLRFLKDEFVIITDKENKNAKKVYFNFYDKIAEKLKSKEKENKGNNNYNPEDFEGIEVDELVPEMDNGKVNDIVQTYLKDEGITEEQVNLKDFKAF